MSEAKYDPEFVEFIVREVIRRLTAMGQVQASQPVESKSHRDLDVSDRLVTLATVQGKLDGVRRVSVRRKAIVTPAVRDELKQRQIELKREV